MHDPRQIAAEVIRGSRGQARQEDLQGLSAKQGEPGSTCFDQLLFLNMLKK